MKCVMISGSPEYDIDFIKAAASDGGYLICADSGYDTAVKAGLKPDLVIGDFDSAAGMPDGGFEIIRLNTDKDYTDTLVCAQNALQRGYDEITILAATGGRLDHTLANLYALDHIAENGGSAAILSEKERIELMASGKERVFKGFKGKTFSLFPFGCESAVLSVRGAEYELNGYELKSSVPIGVSNVFSGEECRITVSKGKALIVINTGEIR